MTTSIDRRSFTTGLACAGTRLAAGGATLLAATGTAARGSGDTKKPRRVAGSKFSKWGFERRGSVQGCTVGNPADHVCRAFVALCNQMLQCGMTAAGKSVIMP